MNKEKFTPISELGEFKLIDKITKGVHLAHDSTKQGIGDDAAVLGHSNKNQQLISSDMLVEGVHFDPTYTPLKHLGYKAVVVNISDICSMNGLATHAVVCLGVPAKYSVEHINELYAGIKMACKNYSIDLIGGDTTTSTTGLIINITIIGDAKAEIITYRKGANPNDILVVSGDLGAAYLGLQILEREKEIFNKNNSQPALSEYQYILARQLKPEARTDLVDIFHKLKIKPTSMIDISDGLSSDVMHICESSGVGVKIFEDNLPIAKETVAVAEELRISPTVCALHGGEDYELLFTIPASEYKKIEMVEEVKTIGHITSSREIEVVAKTGQSIDLKQEGWDSFLNKKK